MNFLNFIIYFGFNPEFPTTREISFSENIEYCASIMHNPNLENEFVQNCDLQKTNNYIMMTKKLYRN